MKISYIKLPEHIRMKQSGNTLTRYQGKPYILDIKGGIIVHVHTGDYTANDEHQDPFWLDKNRDKWEPLE